MARLRAWQARRERLNNTFSAIAGAVGAMYGNVAVQVKSSYDIRQTLIAFGYLAPGEPTRSHKLKEQVTSRICYTDEDGKLVCQ